MRMMVYLSCVVVPSVAWAQTPQTGPVSDGSGGPVTAAQSPYLVTGYAWVPSVTTLTIEPGVTVLHSEGAHWWVEGTLVAEGTLDNPIRFTGTAQAPGSWQRIYLRPGSTARLRHAEVSFSGARRLFWGIEVESQVFAYFAAEFLMSASSVRSGAGIGLWVVGEADAALLISGSTFHENGGDRTEVWMWGVSMTVTMQRVPRQPGPRPGRVERRPRDQIQLVHEQPAERASCLRRGDGRGQLGGVACRPWRTRPGQRGRGHGRDGDCGLRAVRDESELPGVLRGGHGSPGHHGHLS